MGQSKSRPQKLPDVELTTSNVEVINKTLSENLGILKNELIKEIKDHITSELNKFIPVPQTVQKKTST